MTRCWPKGASICTLAADLWLVWPHSKSEADQSTRDLHEVTWREAGLLASRDGAGVFIMGFGWAKATDQGNSGHSPGRGDLTLPPFVKISPSLLLPPCPLSPSPLPERIGPWAWISVKPWRENAPWNYMAPAKGVAICFFFRPFSSTQCIKPLRSGAVSPSW